MGCWRRSGGFEKKRKKERKNGGNKHGGVCKSCLWFRGITVSFFSLISFTLLIDSFIDSFHILY